VKDDLSVADMYDEFAEAYAARVDTKPHNAYYERPATLSLLPDVQGKRVLDAGCGPGVYTGWLVNHGAEVVAVDVSPKMVRLAQQRVGSRARVFHADMSQPLDFAQDETFDLVVSALALHYVRDWDAVFGEFHRVLRRGGQLVFSVGHPFGDFMRHNAGNYFRIERVEEVWPGFGKPVRMSYYRRPLHMLMNSLLGAGFTLERLLEPTPVEAFKQAEPEEYEELMRQPVFLCIRAVKH
jgi:SAM-dependent methyltransferase